MIDGQSYFVLHAPRQVGKTTSLLSLGKTLTAEGRYAALLVTMETGAPFEDDIGRAEGAILGSWRRDAEVWLPKEFWPPPWPAAEAGARIGAALEVANPIYREIIGRSLALSVRVSLPRIQATWIDAEGMLDVEALLAAWVAFWTLHGETMQTVSPYAEAASHLVLLAFLHRVVNGGGRIEREYAAGTGRMNLRVEFKGAVLGIEVKTWRDRDKRADPAVEGVAQLEAYLARVGATHGWLVVFDQRKGAGELSERVRVERVKAPGGREVAVVRV